MKSIALGKDGKISIALSSPFAADAKARLIPKVNPQSDVIDWRCSHEGDDSLRRYLPTCN